MTRLQVVTIRRPKHGVIDDEDYADLVESEYQQMIRLHSADPQVAGHDCRLEPHCTCGHNAWFHDDVLPYACHAEGCECRSYQLCRANSPSTSRFGGMMVWDYSNTYRNDAHQIGKWMEYWRLHGSKLKAMNPDGTWREWSPEELRPSMDASRIIDRDDRDVGGLYL